jgi:hypothetical protein
MNFGHMVGEHSSDRGISGAIFGISVILAVVVGYLVYKRCHKATASEVIKDK